MASFLEEKKILSRIQLGERYAPGGENVIRRVGALTGLFKGDHALVWDCSRGNGAIYLAKKHGCSVTCVEDDQEVLASLPERYESENLGDLVVATPEPPFDFRGPEEEFETFFAEVGFRCVKEELEKVVECGWRLLAPEGLLALTATVRVGRVMPAAVHAYFHERGHELLYPGELAQLLESKGFEPLTMEALGDSAMDEWYRALDRALKADSADNCEFDFVKKEIEVFRREGGRYCIDTVLFLGRRKKLA